MGRSALEGEKTRKEKAAKSVLLGLSKSGARNQGNGRRNGGNAVG